MTSPNPRSPHRPMSISPHSGHHSPGQSRVSSGNHVALQIANDLAALRILESTKKGQIKYDNGWDKYPHSFLKLVSDVQQHSDYSKTRVLERAYQITVREKEKEKAKQRELSLTRRSLGITPEFEDDLDNDYDSNNSNDNDDNSSCSSSTANEFYNNDYYESASASTSRTNTPQPQQKYQQERHVRFLNKDALDNYTPSTSPSFNKQSTSSTTSPGKPIISPSSGTVFPVRKVTQQVTSPLLTTGGNRSLGQQHHPQKSLSLDDKTLCAEMLENSKPILGNILKRGYGIREEEYDDEEYAMGFLQDSLVYVGAQFALAEADQQYQEKFQERINQRRRVHYNSNQMGNQKLSVQIVQTQFDQNLRKSDLRRQLNEKKIRQTVEEGKKQMEALKVKQQIEREENEKCKLANEAERKKINQEIQKRIEVAAAAVAAKAQEEEEARRQAKELEESKKRQEKEDENNKAAAAAKQAEEENEKRKKLQQQQQQSAATVSAGTGPGTGTGQGYEVPSEFQGYILPLDLQRYLKSQQLLATYKEKFIHISAKGPTKDYYCSALKAVNTTLNSIASSPEHIKSKVTHLINLLQGKPVSLGEASNAGTFASGALPQGELFVSNLLAFRFVKKAESEISKGHTSVEPLAYLGVAVARNFPGWAVLVRANFFKMCPFLVPFSFPRNNLSVEDYALAMGHELRGSESAVRQALLDKMTGYCTLYAIMVKIFERQKITDIGESTEFFSIAEVWRILVTTMKLKPQLDMTATVIQILLDNLGDRLSALYGIQFKKLTQFLLQTYLPQIRNETPAGKTAALTRLEIFLEKKLQKGF